MMLNLRSFTGCVVFLALLASASAADNQTSSAAKQRTLIGVLQSDAPPQNKAIACKQLAIYGTQDAVPALAPYLLDKDLASWARTALEAIPGPAADGALREALGKLEGRLLIGTINSIGYRRDAQAVDGLVDKLVDADADVASAAAVALGHIGGSQAAQALEKSLSSAPAGVRAGVAEGCILCAEGFVARGQSSAAVKLFDKVRQADVPQQKRLEATRGAILARQSDGLPLLLEQLRSTDKAQFSMGLRIARELPGRAVTRALAAELGRSSPDRQASMVLALADRSDDAVLLAVLGAARSGPKPARLAALGALERLGNVSCVTVLVEAAAEDDTELAKAAKTALVRLSGQDVDADLLARLPQTAGKKRQALIEVAGQRRMDGALPAILRCADDADAGVRSATVEAVGALGGEPQAGDLVKMLVKATSPKERADIEKALLALTGRCGTATVPYLLPLAKNSDSALRTIGLQTLAGVGGSEALAAVNAAVSDRDEAVQDEAVRILATWPNNWPDDVGVAEPLLALAKSGKKTSHQVLGLRGYLQYIQADKRLKDDEKMAKVNALMEVVKRPEEKRLVIAAIGATPTAGALELMTTIAADPAVAEEACSAIIKLAGRNLPGVSKEQRQKALQTVVEKSTVNSTKTKAEDLLKGLK